VIDPRQELMSPPLQDASPRSAEALRLFDDFLHALCDPEAGIELYRMHAFSAAVRHGDGVSPAGHIDPAAFATAHREISLRGRDSLPRYDRATLVSVYADPGGGETVAWFEVAEAREQRNLAVAVGFLTTHGEQHIGWCTLAAHVEPWSFRDGLLQSLADYPWMRNGTPSPARALLDASYFRRYWRAPVTFHTLPDARFSCMMSAVCCKHDYEITLPAEAQLLIDAMPWQTLQPQLSGTRLAVRPDGKLQLKTVNEHCRFLGPHHQCLIHQTLGRQPFGPCAVFPFSFAHTPEGISVAMSPICGAARRGMGVAPLDREDDLRERFVQSEARRPDAFRLSPDVEISWERFRDIEKALCECLAAEGIPLRRRLHMGSRLLRALRDGEPLDMNSWLTESPVEITGELREALRGMLARVVGWDRAALQALPALLPPNLSNLEVSDSAIVVRILQNTLFSKVYSYPFDLTTAHNFLIVMYLLTLVMQADAPAGLLSDVMWQELGSLGVHGLLKSLLHEGVPDGFRATLGTPECGQWMLAL
jgi:hypothetical protein